MGERFHRFLTVTSLFPTGSDLESVASPELQRAEVVSVRTGKPMAVAVTGALPT
jgi:hypothetical protein